MTLLEAMVVMVVVSLLTAAVAPSASRTFDRVRFARAIEDAEAIKAAVRVFRTELPGYSGFVTNGGATGNPTVELLVSNGDASAEAGAGGDIRWQSPVALAPGPGFVVTDFLENHLVTNNPFGGAAPDAYSLGGVNAWRGAYISAPVDPDPWGNRYAVNTKWMRDADTDTDVVVLSAGPNEQIDTPFAADGVAAGDDDVMVVVHRANDVTVP